MMKLNSYVIIVTFRQLHFKGFFLPFVDKYHQFVKFLKNNPLRILLIKSYFIHLLCKMKVVPHKIHKIFAPHIVMLRSIVYKTLPKIMI